MKSTLSKNAGLKRPLAGVTFIPNDVPLSQQGFKNLRPSYVTG